MDPNQAAPVDPMIPQMEGAPTPEMGTVGMATPEQHQELLGMIDQIESKLGQFNASKFAGENSGKQSKADALRMVFGALQEAGVDIGNQQAVADFIAKVRERNPDLAALFEECVSTLLGNSPAAEPTNDMEMGGLPEMNPTTDETLPPDSTGPLQIGG